ncbi:hypothetical protein SYNTR_1898 [Candidatus Syntrophocurvum alkaliphilum]|uniref:HTH cro/C1-type domain-containing protein n=1 Tax=Candidatus Syntrophocurvum alkaliphilum TaxID=2293317 RepID=A0A6I6DD69_9FIRM|nr:transcriptional regulator [Candidatus Syntrophocurvum alkaliphilum]QGU00492.1 hypothetical protein SYNTR_1898 [Candidatus Syntrophocurvum alkaliphilum]
MLFELINRNKTIKELRRKKGYTAQELAMKMSVYNIDILKIDNEKLKDLKEPLKSRLILSLRK